MSHQQQASVSPQGSAKRKTSHDDVQDSTIMSNSQDTIINTTNNNNPQIRKNSGQAPFKKAKTAENQVKMVQAAEGGRDHAHSSSSKFKVERARPPLRAPPVLNGTLVHSEHVVDFISGSPTKMATRANSQSSSSTVHNQQVSSSLSTPSPPVRKASKAATGATLATKKKRVSPKKIQPWSSALVDPSHRLLLTPHSQISKFESFNVQTDHLMLFKQIIHMTSLMATEGNLSFTPEGVRIQAQDGSRVAYWSALLPAKLFRNYFVEQKLDLGHNFFELNKIFKNITNKKPSSNGRAGFSRSAINVAGGRDNGKTNHSGDLMMKYNSEYQTVSYIFGEHRKTIEKLKIIQLNTSSDPEPDMDYRNFIQLPTEEFMFVIKRHADCYTMLRIDMSPQKVTFTTKSEHRTCTSTFLNPNLPQASPSVASELLLPATPSFSVQSPNTPSSTASDQDEGSDEEEEKEEEESETSGAKENHIDAGICTSPNINSPQASSFLRSGLYAGHGDKEKKKKNYKNRNVDNCDGRNSNSSSDCIIQCTSKFSQLFSIVYLTTFCKGTVCKGNKGIGDYVRLYMEPNRRMLIEYIIPEQTASARFYLNELISSR